MNNELLENNNKVYLQGTVETTPELNHTVLDENFYQFSLRVPRLSGQDDVLPVIISEKLLLDGIKVGDRVALKGQFRSHNKLIDGKSKLILAVYCKELCDWDENANPNVIELKGYICKPTIFRITPFSREICDLLLAVNRKYNKSDYIPCISWGKNAQYTSKMGVGSSLVITGRIQSREYTKHNDENDTVSQCVAYEVSVASVSEMSKDEDAV